MLPFLWHSLWGWWGLTGAIVAACVVVGYFFPSLRGKLLVVAGAALSASTIYTWGSRDRAELERQRKEEAVRRAREAYDQIDRRGDTPDDVDRRLRDGSF